MKRCYVTETTLVFHVRYKVAHLESKFFRKNLCLNDIEFPITLKARTLTPPVQGVSSQPDEILSMGLPNPESVNFSSVISFLS